MNEPHHCNSSSNIEIIYYKEFYISYDFLAILSDDSWYFILYIKIIVFKMIHFIYLCVQFVYMCVCLCFLSECLYIWKKWIAEECVDLLDLELHALPMEEQQYPLKTELLFTLFIFYFLLFFIHFTYQQHFPLPHHFLFPPLPPIYISPSTHSFRKGQASHDIQQSMPY